MKHHKLFALLPAFALLFTLAACEIGADDPTGGPSEEATAAVSPTEAPSEEPANTSGLEPAIRLAVLSGPTGIGAAKLLDSADNNPISLRASYEYAIYSDNSELVAGLTTGEIDIATMASNVAVNLYNKSRDIKIIAAGTLGVLHILEGKGGEEIDSIADLAGKTIYSAGQGANPEYILRHLLQKNELEVVTDEDAVLDSTGKSVKVVFRDAGEIQAGLLNEDSDIRYAMLPVPAATAAIAKGEGKIRAAIDVTDAWNELENGQLIMTAVVARAGFVEEHPELVDAFLDDYKESIDYVNNNLDAAAELVAGYGLTPSAAIAKKAIPQCHLVFLSGDNMMSALSDYYLTLYAIDKASVGGSVPDDGIYYTR